MWARERIVDTVVLAGETQVEVYQTEGAPRVQWLQLDVRVCVVSHGPQGVSELLSASVAS